jgi:hypothetical protein
MPSQKSNQNGYRLENLSQRSRRYANELKYRRKTTGEPLTAAQAGFRMGVLNERKISAKIYNNKQGK